MDRGRERAAEQLRLLFIDVVLKISAAAKSPEQVDEEDKDDNVTAGRASTIFEKVFNSKRLYRGSIIMIILKPHTTDTLTHIHADV